MKKVMRKSEIKQERFAYMINTILNQCEKNHWKKIGLTTSSLKYRYIDKIISELNEEVKKKEMLVKVIELKPIAFSAEAVEQARLCDIIFFVEKYADSYYQDVQRSIELAKKESISIGGVIAYR